MRALVCSLVTALFAAGCVALPDAKEKVDQAKVELNAAALCCDSLARAARLALPIKEPAELLITKESQVFNFNGNKSYFVLYELPAFVSSYSIELVSFPEGGANSSSLLIPQVILYDADFNVTRSFDEKALRNRSGKLEGTIFINAANSKERFAAVYSSASSATMERSHAVMTATPILAGPVFFVLQGGREEVFKVHPSPVGKLRVEVKGLAPATAAR